MRMVRSTKTTASHSFIQKTMKNPYKYLLIIGLASIIPLILLLAIYYFNLEKITYNFTRNIPYKIERVKQYELKYNSYYFGGKTDHHIFLGNYTSFQHVFKISTQLTDTQSITIDINKADTSLTKSIFTLHIDSPYFYLFNGTAPSVLKGNIGKWSAEKDVIEVPYFSQSSVLSSSSLVFRFLSKTTGNYSLRKETINQIPITNNSILEKQVDGRFCTDGILQYCKKLQKIVYLYYYRNEILLIDTNLNLVRKIKTIDPIDTARFKVSEIKSENAITFTSPPLLVNAKCSIWQKYLFVQSKLMGKHEDEARFNNSTVIDIYDLEKGNYVYSFYLPLINNRAIQQFSVIDNYVFTLTGKTISQYLIKLPGT